MELHLHILGLLSVFNISNFSSLIYIILAWVSIFPLGMFLNRQFSHILFPIGQFPHVDSFNMD